MNADTDVVNMLFNLHNSACGDPGQSNKSKCISTSVHDYLGSNLDDAKTNHHCEQDSMPLEQQLLSSFGGMFDGSAKLSKSKKYNRKRRVNTASVGKSLTSSVNTSISTEVKMKRFRKSDSGDGGLKEVVHRENISCTNINKSVHDNQESQNTSCSFFNGMSDANALSTSSCSNNAKHDCIDVGITSKNNLEMQAVELFSDGCAQDSSYMGESSSVAATKEKSSTYEDASTANANDQLPPESEKQTTSSGLTSNPLHRVMNCDVLGSNDMEKEFQPEVNTENEAFSSDAATLTMRKSNSGPFNKEYNSNCNEKTYLQCCDESRPDMNFWLKFKNILHPQCCDFALKSHSSSKVSSHVFESFSEQCVKRPCPFFKFYQQNQPPGTNFARVYRSECDISNGQCEQMEHIKNVCVSCDDVTNVSWSVNTPLPSSALSYDTKRQETVEKCLTSQNISSSESSISLHGKTTTSDCASHLGYSQPSVCAVTSPINQANNFIRDHTSTFTINDNLTTHVNSSDPFCIPKDTLIHGSILKDILLKVHDLQQNLKALELRFKELPSKDALVCQNNADSTTKEQSFEMTLQAHNDESTITVKGHGPTIVLKGIKQIIVDGGTVKLS